MLPLLQPHSTPACLPGPCWVKVAISKLFREPPTIVNRVIPLSAYSRRPSLTFNTSPGSQAPVPGMPPHIVALSDVADCPFFAEPDWSRKSAESHISIGASSDFKTHPSIFPVGTTLMTALICRLFPSSLLDPTCLSGTI
jgi:hypothetical protein